MIDTVKRQQDRIAELARAEWAETPLEDFDILEEKRDLFLEMYETDDLPSFLDMADTLSGDEMQAYSRFARSRDAIEGARA